MQRLARAGSDPSLPSAGKARTLCEVNGQLVTSREAKWPRSRAPPLGAKSGCQPTSPPALSACGLEPGRSQAGPLPPTSTLMHKCTDTPGAKRVNSWTVGLRPRIKEQ